MTVKFEDESEETIGFLAHAPLTRPRGPFVEQLGLELAAPSNDIKVTPPFMQTSKRGVFSAGDNMVMVKAVANALSNASMAAAGASTQIQCEAHGHQTMF